MSLKSSTETISDIVHNKMVATTVATSTVATGVSDWFEFIPDDIGKLASLVGILLTSVLIFFHVRKGMLELRNLQLEIDRKEQERKAQE